MVDLDPALASSSSMAPQDKAEAGYERTATTISLDLPVGPMQPTCRAFTDTFTGIGVPVSGHTAAADRTPPASVCARRT